MTQRSDTQPPLQYRHATAARVLDMPPETLRSLERRGLIRGHRVGRSVYFSRRELERFVAEREAATR